MSPTTPKRPRRTFPIDGPLTPRRPKGDGDQSPRGDRCGTMEEHRRLVRLDPEYRWRRRQIERDVQDWVARFGEEGSRTGVIRIPVVVHVVWHTATENISDAQI